MTDAMTAKEQGVLLQANEALLSGWCGPVQGEHGEGAVLLVEGDSALVAWLHPASPVRRSVVKITTLYLDLSRAECRDRVARVLEKRGHFPAPSAGWRSLSPEELLAVAREVLHV